MNEVPPAVLSAYGFTGAKLTLIPSLINRTLLVTMSTGERFVLQRLHGVFRGEVNVDIDAITKHLVRAGLTTPLIVPTEAGALWFDEPGGSWRTQTFVSGETHHEIQSEEQADGAGFFVARFHGALAGVTHEFAFQRGNPHDTPAHLERLRAALETDAGRADTEAQSVATDILTHASPLRIEFNTPRRLCHGDLKLSNLLFCESNRDEVRCLIDLDTLGPQTIAFELGDALRSWCNRSGESEVTACVDPKLFESTLCGYARGAVGLLTEEEQGTIVDGLAAVSVELASRFARDAIEDRYFGWDERRHPNRRAHNLVRARSQLELSRSVLRQRSELSQIVERVFSAATSHHDGSSPQRRFSTVAGDVRRTRILFASSNPGKLREVGAVLGPLGFEVATLPESALEPEPVEDADSFEGNARIKAIEYARRTGSICLAEDSGLEVDALGGAPGVHSARYAGTLGSREARDAANNEKLLRELAERGDVARTARFVAAMCLASPDGAILAETRGTFAGEIAHHAAGQGGFGYDPLLYLPELRRTSAELTPSEKNARSHRGEATRKLAELLTKVSFGRD